MSERKLDDFKAIFGDTRDGEIIIDCTNNVLLYIKHMLVLSREKSLLKAGYILRIIELVSMQTLLVGFPM